MAKTFICVNKHNEDYSSIPGEKVFIFPEGAENAPADLAPYQRTIDAFLLDGTLNDYLVFNGPSWLIACVVYAR